jgi:hypothetical protein
MADFKISQLASANVVNKDDLFYLIQNDTDFNVKASTLFASITDPTLSGNIIVSGPVQTLNAAGAVSITTTRTDLYGGKSANTAAVASGSVLPTTVFLYTEGVSASGRGIKFVDDTPVDKTFYVRHLQGKIYLSTAGGVTYSYPPENWVGPTGLRPFPTELAFVKGAKYTFDISDASLASNVINLSTSIDGTNTLGTAYTPGVTRNGNSGTPGANIVFIVPNVTVDTGGLAVLDIPQGTDGQLKIINLVKTDGGRYVLSSNLQNNLAVELRKSGDSAFLMYSSNGWILVGSNPGLVTSFSGTSDDIPEGAKLYFTNARARAAITATDNTILYDSTTGTIRANILALSNINLANIIPDTNSVPEGLNLYYTNNRVRSNVIALLPTLAGTGISIAANGVISSTASTPSAQTIIGLTTANVAESVSNLYYTNARVYANVTERLANLNTNIIPLTDGVYDLGSSTRRFRDLWLSGSTLRIGNISLSETSNALIVTNSTGNARILADVISSNTWNNLYTANVIESGNSLYFTNARVYANVIGLITGKANVSDLTTANIAESGSNLYYSNDRVRSNVITLLPTLAGTGISIAANGQISASASSPTAQTVIGLNTANVAESVNNLYYTNSRVRANVIALLPTLAGTGISIDANGIITASANATISGIVGLNTANVVESANNLYYTNARVYANVISLLNVKANIADLSTSNVVEGNNLYYTNARVYANVIGIIGGKANVVDLTTANVTESTNNLYYTNLRVRANVIELLPTLAGTGISIAANGQISSTTSVGSIAGLNTANVTESASNLYYTNARVYANVIGLLNAKANVVDLTTSNVVEGNNLYYTNARVYSNVIGFLPTLAGTGISIAANGQISAAASAPTAQTVIGLNTSNVAESASNLYYTNARVYANVIGLLNAKANTVDLTTANVTESTNNLYYTNARVYANVISLLNAKANVTDLTTSNVVEGNNLYYTNARVSSNVIALLPTLAGTGININANGIISATGNVTVTGITGLNTANVSESSSNLYYTNARVYANVIGLLNGKANVVDLTTANVAESANNLYYTNARARFAVSNSTGVYYDTATGAISIGQSVDTTSNVTFAGLTVNGPINFYGNVTTHSSNNLSISDNMIYLNANSDVSNPDLGFAGNYNDGSYHHAGFFRDATDGTWKVFDNYSPEPDANIFIDTSHATFRLANIAATKVTSNLVGNVTGYVSSISNFTTSNLTEGNNLYYSNARLLANVSEMSINVFADVDITGIVANGTLLWSGTGFVAGPPNSVTASNTTQYSVNVANTVLSISNFTTSNLAEGTNLYFTNTRAVSAFTGANLTVGNLVVTGTITARSNVGLTLGTASQGNLISNAITMTVDTTVTNGIAQLNEILGKLVPASPPTFPGNGYIAINSLSSYRMTNFTQTDNTSSGRNVGGANIVSTVRRVSSYTSTTLNDMGPGNTGTVTLYKNSAIAGAKPLSTGSDNGSFTELVISDNVDYATKTGGAGGFWESFDAAASGTGSSGWNEIYFNHSQGGSSNIAFWYYDSSNPGAVVFSVPSIHPSSNTYANSSTIPHFTSATVFTMTANVKNLSGDMYPTSNTFITGSSATGFGTPSSLNYESAGVTGVPLPLTQNLYVSGGNAQISTTVNIASGFGSTSTAPSLTGINSYTNGTGTFTLGANVLYKTPTISSLTTMEESNIFVQANVGSGAGYGARIINPGSTDNPTQSASATLFNSNTATLLSYDATIVAANCKHDQTNYSVGYLPVGPNLSSGRSGAQYFTFKFVRTSVSKFNVQFTGQVAGMWVALPGSQIDTTAAPTNGWLDMSVAAITSGVPGTGTGGNGSAGCALGGTVTLNSQGTQSKTCTFGAESSSSSATNEIYVRIKLTSGQGITALAILGASN